MEKGLVDFLTKHYGTGEMVVLNDNGKTVTLKIDFGDDEAMTVVVNRRNGVNGNYRVVLEG